MFSSPFKTAIFSTLAAAVVATSLSIEPAYAGGGGGRDASDRTTTSTQTTKTKKKSKSEIHAEALKDVYLSSGMRYFFSKKSRMQRLLDRLYQEEKAGHDHMKKVLKDIFKTGLGKRTNDKKFQPLLADSVLQASRNYNAYKKGKISKKTYNQNVKYWLGFVP